MNLPSTTLMRPDSVQAGIQLLLDELNDWLSAVMDEHLHRDWQGIHDEGTFLTAWAGYHAYTQDARVRHLASNLFDKWEHWARSHFLHGYHPRQEVHHGTEHFIIFLDWLRQIAPDHDRVREALDDGAHHAGNWAEGMPVWFNWDACRYVSYSLGTETVGDEGFNFVDHMRMLHLAMAGWHATGHQHYLSLCEAYGTVWARAIRDLPDVPLYLEGEHAEETFAFVLESFLKAAPQEITPWARIENHMASGSAKILMELWEITGQTLFLQAARRLVQGCIADATSPIANPVGHAASQLILAGTDPMELGLSQETFTQLVPWESLQHRELGIQTAQRPSCRASIGFRYDMPAYYLKTGDTWQELAIPAPASLMLAWTLTHNEEYALDACCLALGKLRLARQVYRDGRHHGCTAQSIAAAVRGHGRCWGIGDVSGVLAHIGAQRAYRHGQDRHMDFPGLYTN